MPRYQFAGQFEEDYDDDFDYEPCSICGDETDSCCCAEGHMCECRAYVFIEGEGFVQVGDCVCG